MLLTAEEFVRRYDPVTFSALAPALAEMASLAVEEPICAARYGGEWRLMLTRAARCLQRIGMDVETREKELAP